MKHAFECFQIYYVNVTSNSLSQVYTHLDDHNYFMTQDLVQTIYMYCTRG